MANFYDSVKQKVDNTMIDIKDFGRYHKYTISESDPVGVFKLKKIHNSRYEEFYNNILAPRSSEGKILCSTASFLWIVHEDVREVLGTYKHLEHLRQTDKALVDYWLKEFERPIEELYPYGVNTISSAYGMIIDYYREWFVRQKYERIYSKGTCFDEWFDLAENNKTLLEGQETPFDIEAVADKAKILMQIRN